MKPTPLLDEFRALDTLGGVLRWAHARAPRAEVVAAVAQDEYTHDVVVRAGPDAYLVFDTT